LTDFLSNNLRQLAGHCLLETDPQKKCQLIQEIIQFQITANYTLDVSTELALDDSGVPGRPLKPTLVKPLDVKRRAMHTTEGRATAIHALAHIEFNAINLALDAVWRFSEMPKEFYLDWLRVASEEAKHFQLLEQHLQTIEYSYGDFPAHDSLWEMVEKTKHSILARMALVPRTMEARGLDAVPAIRARFLQVKDQEMVNILDIILHDEVGHVEIGNKWFNYLCQEKQLDPITTYAELAHQYKAPPLRGPFNLEARKRAGFTEDELNLLILANDSPA
jgi:uncharacterized ferritin-like protein (DUF455 family)